VEIVKRQTTAAYGCPVAGQRPWARLDLLCDTKAPLQLRHAACGAI